MKTLQAGLSVTFVSFYSLSLEKGCIFYVVAGILDIYGFECFAYNSLEQLCINYANEKLQQHFVKHFLKEIQDEYANEALPWTEVTYSDNTECVNLLESNPGIFAILNEVSWVNPREFG